MLLPNQRNLQQQNPLQQMTPLKNLGIQPATGESIRKAHEEPPGSSFAYKEPIERNRSRNGRY